MFRDDLFGEWVPNPFEARMSSPTSPVATSTLPVRGKILEAEIKVSVDPGHPLPLACALYAVESEGGVWLCVYYGTNRSVFDFLPQKGAQLDESTAGITFQFKQFVPSAQYQPGIWDEFKKSRLMTYDEHAAGG
jgi:hypothetical protein